MPAQGVRLVFYNDESDILLLQQMSEIPRDFKPFFMGESSALECKIGILWHVQCCVRCCKCNGSALVCYHVSPGTCGRWRKA